MKSGTLKVPGATLYYEVRGSGPPLLLVAAPMDATFFEPVAERLAEGYTVVSYDPRGITRSRLDGPLVDQRVAEHAADAAEMIQSVAAEPAHVFGSSGGGVVALDLLIRHPELVRTVVAHEPPMGEVLPEPEAARWRAFTEELYDTWRREGGLAAQEKFLKGLEFHVPEPPPDAEMAPEAAEAMNNALDLFYGHMIRQFPSYVPDIAALDANRARLVLAGGAETGNKFPYTPAVALAARLGIGFVDFPGDHGGFMSQPEEFAATLHEVLTTAGGSGRQAGSSDSKE